MCHSVEDVVAVIWLAAAAAGKSSASLFPQDVVARRRRAARRRLRHRRRRQRFQPQSLLGQDVCVHVCVCVCVGGEIEVRRCWGGDASSGVASDSAWENRSDASIQTSRSHRSDQCVTQCSVCVCSVCVFSVCVFGVCSGVTLSQVDVRTAAQRSEANTRPDNL